MGSTWRRSTPIRIPERGGLEMELTIHVGKAGFTVTRRRIAALLVLVVAILLTYDITLAPRALGHRISAANRQRCVAVDGQWRSRGHVRSGIAPNGCWLGDG
jgi:hypothetical protein